MSSPGVAEHRSARSAQVIVHLGIAALSWVPLLLTAPGRVAADTRQHLHLDPGEFIARARSVWDPLVHMGTVTHQNIGLVFPMGAWSWLVDVSGMPVWVGQRLWVGAILFAAAAGVLHLGRTLGWGLAGASATAVVYALSPYVLQYATRTSVLLLPFAGLPWLLSLVIRAGRTGGWRHPAAFALVVGIIGSVNPTSLILVGLAPVLWLVVAVVTSELTLRRAVLTGARVGVLCAGTSAWWIASLWVQSRHGLPVLTYTETIGQVATTSGATEVLRGLGYWVFYGREVLDPNVGAAAAYMQNPALLTLSYLLPAAGLLAAFLVRFRHRGFFVAMTVLGFFVAVGAYPMDDPSLASSWFAQATETTAGLAMRSSTRAVPLVALGLAVGIGRGVEALGDRIGGHWRLTGAAALAAVLALPALFSGGFVDQNLSRPEQLPEHWTDAAAFFETVPDHGAILELPGIQFATYRWGTTYEPVSPALFDQPVIAREQLPYGSPPSADLLIALDRRLQEGVIEPEALAPIARLMGAHWVLLRHDLAYERYVSARPERIRHALSPLPDGLEVEATFGAGYRNEPDDRLPLLDEEALSLPVEPSTHPALEVLRVTEPADRVRTAPVAGATILAGDGEGLVDLAAAGLLRPDAPVLYATTALSRPEVLAEALDGGAELVVTDTARKRERRWRSVRWATGHTEREDERSAAPELGDGDLEVFDDPPPDARSTTIQRGVRVDASAYGGPYTLDPDVRPALAVDGRPETAWVLGPVSDPVGARLHVVPDQPVATDEISVTQRPPSDGGNHITRLSVRVDGADPVAVELDDRSFTPEGQPIAVDDGPVSGVEVEILATSLAPIDGGGPVGIAELRIGDAVVDEVVALPTALLDEVGPRARRAPLTYVMTRLRSDPAEPVRGDEERSLRRQLDVPDGRTFQVTGAARIDHTAPGDVVDDLLALDGPRAVASTTLPGNLRSRAGAAVDGDPSTAWRPAFRDLEGSWLEVVTDEPVRLDTLDLDVVADLDHSLPTEIELLADGRTQVIEIPPIERSPEPGSVRELSLPIEPVTDARFRVTIRTAEPRITTDYYTRGPIPTPIGIAELRLPTTAQADPSPVDTGCRDDLVTLDGRPVSVRVTGSADAALDGAALEVQGCDDIALEAGTHELRTAEGPGIEVDRLVLRSSPADPVPDAGQQQPAVTGVRHPSPTKIEAEIGSGDEAWLVLAQSHGDAWEADLDGRRLGPPVLIDGGFNGWRLPAGGEHRSLELEWRPQQTVDRAIVATLLAGLLSLVLLVVPRRPPAPLPVDPPVRPGFLGGGEALGWRPAMALVSLLPAVVGLLVLGPLGALVAGAASLASLRLRRGRLAVAITALGAWLAAAGWIVLRQVLDPRPADFAWAGTLHTPHDLAVLTVVLLVAAAAADWYRSTRHTEHRRERT